MWFVSIIFICTILRSWRHLHRCCGSVEACKSSNLLTHLWTSGDNKIRVRFALNECSSDHCVDNYAYIERHSLPLAIIRSDQIISRRVTARPLSVNDSWRIRVSVLALSIRITLPKYSQTAFSALTYMNTRSAHSETKIFLTVQKIRDRLPFNSDYLPLCHNLIQRECFFILFSGLKSNLRSAFFIQCW